MKKLLNPVSVFLSFLVIIVFLGFNENENIVNKVDVGVVVSDLERSREFYTKIVGMEQSDTWHATKEMATSYGINSGKAFDIINMKLDCKGYVLKYKLNQTVGNIHKDKIIDSASDIYSFEKLGTRYLTINVESVDPFIKRIKENNIKYKLVTLSNGLRVVLLHDPDGALLEITSF
jgi:catechol 2,3-dioxygenase-like lactoylglutathione lyase family enzyme